MFSFKQILILINQPAAAIFRKMVFVAVLGIFFSSATFAQAATFSISGTLYTDAGVTPAAAGKTINIAVGTSTPSVFSTTTSSGGGWTFTNIDDAGIATSTPFTVWLDGDADDATTILSGFASSTDLSGVPLYYNYLLSYGATTSSLVDFTAFDFYDASDDADILYSIPGATNSSISGDFLIKRGVFNAPTSTLSLSGDYDNEATFIGNNGTLALTGTAKTLDGVLTGTSTLSNLLVSGSYTFSTTTASTTNLTIQSGGSLTAPANLTVYGNFNNQGAFDENGGTLYMENISGDFLQYLAGMDLSGLSSGVESNANLREVANVGNYLYVGTGGNTTACSQTAGSAIGCELQVYDISNPTTPVYVAGRDSSGNSAGINFSNIHSLTTAGNYLYVGMSGSATACSQTAGSAIGCELQIYDVSSSTNLIYVAGRDVSGNSTGTGNSQIYSLTTAGNYLYVGKLGNATACSQTAGSAIGCEIMVYDISSSTNPIYVAGRDISGNSTGNGNAFINSLTILGNFLYVGGGRNSTACSQTAGSTIGCELQVYDISSSTNPIYVAGRDISGNGTGTGADAILSLNTLGNYLYVGKESNATACSQTAGSAIGCELQIYDISSSTNPIYVAGRDISGSSDGVFSGNQIESLSINGNYLYAGTNYSSTACSQTAGSAIGCELQIYDVSIPTIPVYVAGRDGSGNANGSSAGQVNDSVIVGSYLYLARYDYTFGTACSQTAGSAEGCELQVYDLKTPSGLVLGNLTNTSALGNLQASGLIQIKANASTTDITIQTGQASFPEQVSIGGQYTNNALADFSLTNNLYFSGNSAQSISGSLSSTSSLPNTTFLGTGTKTLESNASTSNFTIEAGASVATNYPLEVSSSFTNAGDFTSGPLLAIEGSYTNNGMFDNGGGVTEIEAYIGKYLAGRDASGNSTGTGNTSITSLTTAGNYLYMGKDGNATACSQTAGSAIGCELMVFDISDTNNPVYVAGRDVDGSATGVWGSKSLPSLIVSGNYLYVGTSGNSNACSQAAGSAQGCELMVFDISSSTNPVYVAGRDASGNSTGTGFATIQSLIVSGNYLYVGTTGISTACSQTAGSALGCEIKVFDITTPTNPTYVAGRDISGNSTGTGNSQIYSLAVSSTSLYVGTFGNATACSQTAGSALGCEIKVFDITTPTNPIYVAGRDVSGDSAGIASVWIYSLIVNGTSLYAGTIGNTTACSQTVGAAEGCELQVYDISSSTNPVYVAGRDGSGNSTGTSNNSIFFLTTAGNYLYVGKNNNAIACSQTAGAAEGCELQIYDISSSTNPVFASGRDSSGNSAGTGNDRILSLTTLGNYLYVGKWPNSTACSQTAGFADGCELMVFQIAPTISGNLTNTNAFADLVISGTGAVFQDNASTTNLTINSGAVTAPSVLSIGDTFSNYADFNANGGEVVFLGAEHFINGTTTFFDLTKEATGSATTTFEAGSLTTIEGEWKFSTGVNLHALRSSIDTEYWYVDPQGTLNLARLDVKDSNNINVTTAVCASGCIDSGNNINWSFEEVFVPVTLEDHSLGQVSDQFSFQNKTDEPIFAFSLNSTTTDLSITDIVFTLYGVQNLSTTSVASLRLVEDNNNDRLLDGGDTVIDAAGIMNINGQNGAITFSTDFTLASTSTVDYLVVANITGIEKGANLNITLQDIGVTATVALDVTNTVSAIQHDYQANSGGGGASARTGGSAPPGASVETGGGGGGGGAAGQEADGENIASDPDFYKPTATGGAFNEWTNGANALLSDGVYATAATTSLRQSYNNFNFNIPGGNTIQGLAVKLDASGTTAAGTIDVSISWDGGSTYTTAKATPTMSGSDLVYQVGGATDTWGRSWSPTEFTSSLFILRVSAQPSSNTIRLDALEIRVYHQTGGGGGGGGGRT